MLPLMMTPHFHTYTLAQSIDPKAWLYFGLLLAMVFAGAMVIFALRKSLLTNDTLSSQAPGGGLLEHLDEMRRTGQITKEEYDATRRTIIDRAAEQMNAQSDNKPIDPADYS